MKRLKLFFKNLFSRKTLDPPIIKKEYDPVQKYTGHVTFFEPINEKERFEKANTIDEFLNIKL